MIGGYLGNPGDGQQQRPDPECGGSNRGVNCHNAAAVAIDGKAADPRLRRGEQAGPGYTRAKAQEEPQRQVVAQHHQREASD